MADKGTEWGNVRDGVNMVQMDSVFNQVSVQTIEIDSLLSFHSIKWQCFIVNKHFLHLQRIEAFWSNMLRHSDINWYRGLLRRIEAEGYFNTRDEIDR